MKDRGLSEDSKCDGVNMRCSIQLLKVSIAMPEVAPTFQNCPHFKIANKGSFFFPNGCFGNGKDRDW